MKHLIAAIPLWICSTVMANTDSAQFYFQIGLQEKKSGKFLVASKAFDKAIKFNPSFVDAILESGFTFLEMRKTDPAKACFTKALELDPNNKIANRELMVLCFNYRQFAKAIELAQKCSDCDNASKIIGISYYETEDFLQAEKYLKAALQKTPDDKEASYHLARNYVEMEEYKKAIAAYEKVTKLDGAKSSWMYELGLLYYNQNDFKNAVISFNNSVNNGYAQTADFKENYGYAMIYSGEYEKGESLLMSVWEKKPGNKDILRDMAEVLYKQKQYDRSLAYCQKLMEMDLNDGKALYQAGLNFQRKGQTDRGQQMCDKAIELDPSLDSLKRKKDISGL